jgi:hypothetical protein
MKFRCLLSEKCLGALKSIVEDDDNDDDGKSELSTKQKFIQNNTTDER